MKVTHLPLASSLSFCLIDKGGFVMEGNSAPVGLDPDDCVEQSPLRAYMELIA